MIPNRFAAGHHAVSCLEQLAILEETASKTNSKSFAGKEIGNLIIVDRSLDWATVLLRYYYTHTLYICSQRFLVKNY